MPSLVPFMLVALALIVVPGADMALVTKTTLARGRRPGLETVAGIITGVGVHGAAAAIGLSAVIAASATAFRLVQILGAIYLIALGLGSIISAYRSDEHTVDAPAPTRPASTPFAEGLITNVMNPKLVVFFLSLMPQFINSASPAIPQIIVLSATYMVLGTAWLVVYVWIVDRVKRQFQHPRVRRSLDAVSGTILIALGLRLIATRN